MKEASQPGPSGRGADKVRKAWRYLLAALATPSRLPWLAGWVVVRRAHAGELLRLVRYAGWLRELGIETVLDIGAHQGEFSSAVRAVVPAARIFCFEPQADARERIERRIHRPRHLEVFPVAISDHRGRAAFFRSAFTKASSLLPMASRHREAFPWTAETETIEVDVKPLDDFADSIEWVGGTLLKIDVQGSELAVLRGADSLLSRVDCVLVETSTRRLYEGDASFSEVHDHLLTKGFRYAGSLDQLDDAATGEILQQDSFFIRESR